MAGAAAGGEFTLHHNTGSPCSPNDYEPHAKPLGPGADKADHHLRRPVHQQRHALFQRRVARGKGVIVVLGWPGQWAAEFNRDEAAGLRVRGGPGIDPFQAAAGRRGPHPAGVLQFWKGDRIRSQNVWRRWMLAHNMPRPGGKPMPPGVMVCTSDFYPGMKSNAADEIKYVDAYVKAGVKLDYWWIDAGWYPCGDDWGNVGTWEPDPSAIPRACREVADHVHAKGMKFVVWFEPERVTPGTWLAENHPEWVLGGKAAGC